jgi:hypothetical protein
MRENHGAPNAGQFMDNRPNHVMTGPTAIFPGVAASAPLSIRWQKPA